MDKKGEERKDTLIVPYNRAIHANSGRPYIIKRTIKKHSVTMVMMSGTEIEIPLKNVETYLDLMSEVVKVVQPKKGTRISILDGDRVLAYNNPRVFFTDDTVLTIVLYNAKKHLLKDKTPYIIKVND